MDQYDGCFEALWIFARTGKTTLEVQVRCETEHSEHALISDALKIINEVERFGGELMPLHPRLPVTAKVAVSFTLGFHSESEIAKYLGFLNENPP